MGSSRLPGKVLTSVEGTPLLRLIIDRLQRAEELSDVVVATTVEARDNAIADRCGEWGVPLFRGSEADVLGRYARAARQYDADLVVRVTGDCPLIDPEVVDLVVRDAHAHRRECDYVSNIMRRTFPRGLDTEVFFRDTLDRVDRLAGSMAAREHVTHFILNERSDLFLTRSVTGDVDLSNHRWTVDEPPDLDLVRTIYRHFGHAQFGFREVVEAFKEHPDWTGINRGVTQKVIGSGGAS